MLSETQIRIKKLAAKKNRRDQLINIKNVPGDSDFEKSWTLKSFHKGYDRLEKRIKLQKKLAERTAEIDIKTKLQTRMR